MFKHWSDKHERDGNESLLEEDCRHHERRFDAGGTGWNQLKKDGTYVSALKNAAVLKVDTGGNGTLYAISLARKHPGTKKNAD